MERKRKIQKIISLIGIGMGLICAIGSGTYAAESDKIPPMPKGYASEDEVKAAILTGQVKLIEAVKVAIPENVVEEKNIEYGKVGDRSLQLDLYHPKTVSKPAPGIIFIHGGGWKSGQRDIMKFYCVRYAQKGYVTATISYRLTKEALYPAAVQDAKCAVRWMRANAAQYHIDPQKIAMSGNSAGAHLAMMVGYAADVPELEGTGGHSGVSSRIQAVVDFYGPVDLTTPFSQQSGVVKDFLGKTYAEDPKLYAAASPYTYLTRNAPPTLILHGTIDTTVPFDQPEKLAAKLKELGVPFQFEKFVGWPHTMDLAEPVNQRCCYDMDCFFAKYLPLP